MLHPSTGVTTVAAATAGALAIVAYARSHPHGALQRWAAQAHRRMLMPY